MSDPWVTSTQNWLNNTYGNVSGWQPLTVTGQTGWPTMYALTRALQVELGISPLSPTFGPTTLSRLAAVGDIGPGTSSDTAAMSKIRSVPNLYNIIRGAFYCKGYNGGNGALDGTWSATTTSATKAMRQDIGLPAGTGVIAPKIFKALLTLDAYVLLQGGSASIRSIQQDFNQRYLNRADFFVLPADGYFSRSVQSALTYALQYEEGLADGVANGTFGPTTQSNLKSQGLISQEITDGSKYFVHLYQAALNFNGYPAGYDGVFSSSVAAATLAFQSFAALPQNGKGDFATWASLLVSTGDPSRSGTALDTATPLTSSTAATVWNSGYRVVGRYLTNTPNVTNPLNKKIQNGELTTLFQQGLKVYPIFQQGGDSSSYFSYQRGLSDARTADAAARSYGFKDGTIVYFAVDFDAIEDDVNGRVIPHFRGIADGLYGINSAYKVGIYGTRNTCTLVSARALATTSFVSDMSTGYSGNLGFGLPSNWAFDQIQEYTVGSGGGSIAIDKDISSGRDAGQASVQTATSAPAGVNVDMLSWLSWLDARAREYVSSHTNARPVDELICQYMRRPKYTRLPFQLLGGDTDDNWISFVNTQAASDSIVPVKTYKVTETEEDAQHFFYALGAYIYRGLPSTPSTPAIVDIAGWAGDLASLLNNYDDYLKTGGTLSSATWAAGATGGLNNNFEKIDLVQDVDGLVVANAIVNAGRSVLSCVRDLLNDNFYAGENRYQAFQRVRFGSSQATMTACAEQVFLQPATDSFSTTFNSYREIVYLNSAPAPVHPSDYTAAQLGGLGDGFAQALLTFSV